MFWKPAILPREGRAACQSICFYSGSEPQESTSHKKKQFTSLVDIHSEFSYISNFLLKNVPLLTINWAFPLISLKTPLLLHFTPHCPPRPLYLSERETFSLRNNKWTPFLPFLPRTTCKICMKYWILNLPHIALESLRYSTSGSTDDSLYEHTRWPWVQVEKTPFLNSER